jgi:hypothetical protein
VRENKQLASRIAAVLAAATLLGTSAFAESRHSNETRTRSEGRATVRREGVVQRSEGRRSNESRNGGSTIERRGEYRAPATSNPTETRTWGRSDDRSSSRNYDRNNNNRNRNDGNRNDGNRNWNRNDNRNRSNGSWRGNDNRGNNHGSYGSRGSYGSYNGGRQSYYHRGRVTRYSPWNGGYRVWIYGSPYPFYVPLAYWNPSRFRIGVTIGLGGYYNDLGYYDYYDGYRDGYYDSYRSNPGYRGNSDADFRGTVESVDRRGDSFVVRNEATGSFITVVLRDRREGTPRVGDYVAVRGDWTNSGYFRAYDVDFLDYDNRDDRRY